MMWGPGVARVAADLAVHGATTLIELGSGTSEKTLLLLDALHAAGSLDRFVPFDTGLRLLWGIPDADMTIFSR